jgi:hypothetical protein
MDGSRHSEAFASRRAGVREGRSDLFGVYSRLQRRDPGAAGRG